VAQIQFSTSLAFAATARRVLVGQSQPGKLDPKRTVELGEFGDLGLVRAEARFAVGERVFERSGIWPGPAVGEPRVVAEIDRETRASMDEWLIAWAEEPRSCVAGTAQPVTLDAERFEHVLLAWVSDQTKGGQATADLNGFAPGDIPLGCTVPLAQHLQAAGLLRMSPEPGSAIISLTAEGIAAAELAASERTDQRRRAEELRNGIIRWLWERDDVGAVADFKDFPRNRHCTFRGHFFDLQAVHREYLYLTERGLLYPQDGPWWFAPALTAAGRDCAAYHGGNVQDHLNPQPANGPTVNFNGNNTGNVAIGREVTQTASTGTTPTSPPAAAAPAPPGRAAVTATGEAQSGQTSGFWHRFRAIATGTAGVVTLVCTVVIAIFTVLIWLIMSK
jgi:hypothetical protein